MAGLMVVNHYTPPTLKYTVIAQVYNAKAPLEPNTPGPRQGVFTIYKCFKAKSYIYSDQTSSKLSDLVQIELLSRALVIKYRHPGWEAVFPAVH